jgi:hypothetical protein
VLVYKDNREKREIHMLEIKEIRPGFFKALNIVSEHDAYIDTDMLGDYRGTVEVELENGTYEGDESPAYNTIEEAANWIECQGVVMTTCFDGRGLIQA